MKTGQTGENTAEKFLKKQGYQIVERNFRCKTGEIDLIVKKHNIMAFVEVKTRNSLKYGLPFESITPNKIKHIRSTAHWYASAKKNSGEEMDYRFDVIQILRLKDKQYINHIVNAF